MNNNEMGKFAELWVGIYETYNKQIKDTTLAIFFDVLKEYSFDQVRDGLKAHLKDPKGGSFVPRPSDVIRFLNNDELDGRVGADVAWTMIPHSEDESTVWTDEIAAAYGVCLPLINQGDTTAARMAFREEYERQIKKSRKLGIPNKWRATLGHCDTGRETAKQKAKEMNEALPSHNKQVKVLENLNNQEKLESSESSPYTKKGKTKTLLECAQYFDQEIILKSRRSGS